MRSWRLAIWLAGAGMTAAVPALAGAGMEHSAIQAPRVDERDYLLRLHSKNQEEIRIALLGVGRAQSPEVKALSEQMVRDYQQQDEALFHYASRHGLKLMEPRGTGGGGLDLRHGELAEVKGSEFDRAFLRKVADDARAMRDNATQAVHPAQLNLLHVSQIKLNNDHLQRAEDLLQRLPAPYVPPGQLDK